MTDPTQAPHDAAPTAGVADEIAADTLVEEVSIDGMCGVY